MRVKPSYPNLTAIALAVTAIVAAIAYAPFESGWFGGILRTVVGVALVLVLPGYALTRMLFAHRTGMAGGDAPIHGVERTAWTIGLSVAVAVAGAFLLNLLPSGLTRTGWSIFLVGVTVVAGVGAQIRQRRYGQATASRPASRTALWAAPPGTATAQRRLGARRTAAVVAAALLALVALDLARESERGVPHPDFAQLWLVPQAAGDPGADAESGASAGASAGAGAGAMAAHAQLGVRSSAEGDRQFRLMLRHDGRAALSWSFTLSPGEVWQQRVDLRPGQLVEAQLYRHADQSPYRRVSVRTP